MTKETQDTPPHIRKILIEGYRRMSPGQKLKLVSEMTQAVQQLALARIEEQYEVCSDREKRLRLASLWLDRETMIRVFQCFSKIQNVTNLFIIIRGFGALIKPKP